MAKQPVPGEGVLIPEHHFHHRFVFVMGMVSHSDDSQIPGTDLMNTDVGAAAVHKVARFQIHTCLP